MAASRSRYGRWPNPVRDSNGQHDNAVRLSFRLTRGAAPAGHHTPLGHDPATVRWRKWIMPRGLVRAVGIEPTLLAERDFESDETIVVYRRNQRSETRLFPNSLEGSGNQPFLRRKWVSICVNERRAKACQEPIAAFKNAVAVNIAKIFGCRTKAPPCPTLSSPAAKWRQSRGRRRQRGA